MIYNSKKLQKFLAKPRNSGRKSQYLKELNIILQKEEFNLEDFIIEISWKSFQTLLNHLSMCKTQDIEVKVYLSYAMKVLDDSSQIINEQSSFRGTLLHKLFLHGIIQLLCSNFIHAWKNRSICLFGIVDLFYYILKDSRLKRKLKGMYVFQGFHETF